jgi:hypothetical protein
MLGNRLHVSGFKQIGLTSGKNSESIEAVTSTSGKSRRRKSESLRSHRSCKKRDLYNQHRAAVAMGQVYLHWTRDGDTGFNAFIGFQFQTCFTHIITETDQI